ncbi:MAG: diacylglycerol kinase family protein [Flavobacteriales bacterium]|nr:diacylglycerol kinase family protein [Flavobacteriales bacterium]
MKHGKFSLRKRLASFRYAFAGIKALIRDEHNARIHLVATLCAVAAGFYFRISSFEWMAVAIAVGLVFITEAINTAIEQLADVVSPGKNDRIGRIKDIAAAAVLLSAITAAVIGLIVFGPKVVAWFR